MLLLLVVTLLAVPSLAEETIGVHFTVEVEEQADVPQADRSQPAAGAGSPVWRAERS